MEYIGTGKYNKKVKCYFHKNKFYNIIPTKHKDFIIKICVGSFWIRWRGRYLGEKEAIDKIRKEG